ncbi:MAG: alpha/beta hydrolase [Chitinophagales bacterium]
MLQKKWLTLLLILHICLHASGQSIPDISGIWQGTLSVGVNLRVVFHIEEADGIYFTSMDSPDQGVEDIPCSGTFVTEDSLIILVEVLHGEFRGVLNKQGESAKGVWTQNGAHFPLTISKVDSVIGPPRPQMPKEPYPYTEKEIHFENFTDGVTLGATLTIPPGEGPFPAVILVTGSGPQDRNEFLLGHAPFLVLADHMTRNGIIVLRYDDRGVGESTGNFQTATTLDFARDADAAVQYLNKHAEEYHINKIGVAGHSEGGLIAPMVAVDDSLVDFIVLLAGPGLRGDSILQMQQRLILQRSGIHADLIAKYGKLQKAMIDIAETEKDLDSVSKHIIALQKEFIRNASAIELIALGISKDDTLNAPVDFYATPWMQFFLSYDPAATLEKVRVPVLAINGKNDLQVPCDANLEAIEKALQQGNNTQYKTVAIPRLNHLFQTSATGLPGEYGNIEETFNAGAMQIVSDWILGLER